MTKMAEEYHQRTADFSGVITKKLPFYLFKNANDYYDAGGHPGSGGVFNGKSLMAIAGEKATGGTWQVVQHEGLHQFAHAVIGGQLPTWADEGLAEYFAHALFTGDGFVAGVIPPSRLARLKTEITEKQLKSIEQMMAMSHAQWNAMLSKTNYDQGWSMVYFLVHAENGKYQKPFANFINQVGRRQPWQQAWMSNFGTDLPGFEKRWREYWLALDENPTADLYLKATTATFTSFLARANSQKQTFATFAAFAEAAESAGLKSHPDDWLPPTLISAAIKRSSREGTWAIDGPATAQRIVCSVDGKPKWIGTFTLLRNRIGKIKVDAAPKGPATRPIKP
jgi:hypothetical protein